MLINYEDINDNLRRIIFNGRFDMAGTNEIAMKFSALAASANRRVVVDLTAVSFLASIGIGALVSSAKALQMRGGRMVLFVGNNAAVTKVLEVTGIDSLLPMFSDAAAAEKAALA
jgi:anti-sigma B factor antagonist